MDTKAGARNKKTYLILLLAACLLPFKQFPESGDSELNDLSYIRPFFPTPKNKKKQSGHETRQLRDLAGQTLPQGGRVCGTWAKSHGEKECFNFNCL